MRLMALLYDATLKPTKLELLEEWVPQQSWYPADRPGFELIGRFRFDDPAGEVGMETFLLGDPDGSVFHVPMTYRGEPLEGGTLVTMMEHSVLGDRWVYDAVSDPVYLEVLADVIATGAQQAQQFIHQDDGPPTEVPTSVRAWGVPAAGDAVAVDVLRSLDLGAEPPSAGALLAQWEGQATPVVLARA